MAAQVTSDGLSKRWTADHSNFLCLLLTTPMSIFLLYCSMTDARYSGDFYYFIAQNRPMVQLGVQIIANLLAISQILVLCRLINFALRRWLVNHPLDLDSLKLWVSATGHHMDWGLPWNYWILLLFFMIFTTVLRGLWAAALTPYVVDTKIGSKVAIPDWEDYSAIKEYPSEAWLQGPTLQNERGMFTYSLATQLRGQYITNAASATTLDGQPRQHRKIDKSRYTYIGRSYGVGSSPGLVTDSIEKDSLSLAYAYRETGLHADVECIYNKTSDYKIFIPFGASGADYGVTGELPDSDNGEEWAVYPNMEGNSIVSMGVGHFFEAHADELPLRKYVAIAAGETYDFLDKIQCEVNFVPTTFEVVVNVKDRNITVSPTDDGARDIDPSNRLKGTLMRQLALMSNDETNLYVSVFGNAFNVSITDLKTQLEINGNPRKLNKDDIVLQGVGNSITSMVDDMLASYGAAQIMVRDLSNPVSAKIRVSAVAIGEFKFAIAIFVINCCVIVLFLSEVIRTSWWKGLPRFDFSDVRMIAIAASEGGRSLGDLAYGKTGSELGHLKMRYEVDANGRYAITARDLEKEEATPIMSEVWETARREDRPWAPKNRDPWI